MAIYQGKSKTPVAENVIIDSSVYCVPIGSIIPYSSTTAPKGFLICDGAEISKTDYADLYAVIGDKFGSASDGKFKLPDLRDKFVQGANENLGTVKDAGLPNITGEWIPGSVPDLHSQYTKGAIRGTSGVSDNIASYTQKQTSGYGFSFDASKSNPIYGKSTTVQPPAVCLCYIIKATKMSDVPVDADSIIDDVNTASDMTWSSEKITDELNKNISKEQGVSNVNKRLIVGTDGNLGLTEIDGYVTDTIVVTDDTEDFDPDILKWDTGTYKISHRTDLINLPFDVDNDSLCFRLEHHNLKKWSDNHNPNTQTYGVRYSVLYCQNGSTYTREYESGATAGTYSKDTGWRKITQDKYSLVTNSQTFKFTIKKNRFSWFGFAKFEYTYGASKSVLSEIDFAITTAAISYTVVKGRDIVESLTYTFDENKNPTIGIKLKEKVFGTQSLTVPSEFGAITEFTSEDYSGSVTVIKNSNEFIGSNPINSVEIDLSDDSLQYNSNGYNKMSLANYIASTANVVRVEGYYNPPNTSYSAKIPISFGNNAGQVYYTDNNWYFNAVGSDSATGSGMLKLYYV